MYAYLSADFSGNSTQRNPNHKFNPVRSDFFLLAPTFAALIPARRLGPFAPSGFALRACILGRFTPSRFVLCICILGRFAPSGFVLCTRFNACLRRCATLHHHHLKKKTAPDRNRTCKHVLIRSAVQPLNHSATGEAL